MITIQGKSVFGGVSIGKLMFYKRNEKVIKREHISDADAEWKRFEAAKGQAVDQLKELYEKALEDVGEANAMIFEIHQMMLEDLDYLESIENIIRSQEVNAEYAVATTADNFAQMFASMDDAYMQGRAADVKDVSERVLDILCGVSAGVKEMTEPPPHFQKPSQYCSQHPSKQEHHSLRLPSSPQSFRPLSVPERTAVSDSGLLFQRLYSQVLLSLHH